MPAGNAIFTRNRRAYVTAVSTFGTAVAPLAANCFRHIDVSFSPSQPESVRPDLNPSLDIALGTLGRKSCTFQGSCTLAASAAAGTAPDIGKILKSFFGKETVTAGTSVAYECDDVVNYIDLYQYVTPSTGEHEAGLSSAVSSIEFQYGGNYTICNFSGATKSYITSQSYAGTDTEGKCGLGAFPAEPASPVVNGAGIPGNTGTIMLDGNAYTIMRSGSLKGENGFEMDHEGWGSLYPQAGAPGQRRFTFDITLADDDSAQFNALKGKAINGTPVDCSWVLGSIAGGIYTFTAKNILLGQPVKDNSQNKRLVRFSNALCHATTGTSKDAFKIVIT